MKLLIKYKKTKISIWRLENLELELRLPQPICLYMLALVVNFLEIWLQIAVKFLNARILILKIHIDKEIHSHRDIQTKRHTNKET